jgi:hypothetical protein
MVDFIEEMLVSADDGFLDIAGVEELLRLSLTDFLLVSGKRSLIGQLELVFQNHGFSPFGSGLFSRAWICLSKSDT